MASSGVSVIRQLPEPVEFKSLLLKLAVLNIVLCPDEWDRKHSYQFEWSAGMDLATFNNLQGDDVHILLGTNAGVLKGFFHESPISPHELNPPRVWQGIYGNLPKELYSLLGREGLERSNVTFCLWWDASSNAWLKGAVDLPKQDADGMQYLLDCVTLSPDRFCSWAGEYLGRDIDSESVSKIYAGEPITKSLVKALAPNRKYDSVVRQLKPLPINFK